jgi:LmbE family N-acetylglucosaminyl deacetylase
MTLRFPSVSIRVHPWLKICAATVFFLAATGTRAAETPTPAAAAPTSAALIPQVLQDLRSFRELGSVLYIAAHPDDENTQLITYLARGRGYRTAYLSVTRGDGGQNESGPEFGEKLGLARTQELLAARRLDGGRQFFTRAIDFGFSKDVNEALRIWDHKEVLGDVVRVIRTFRPDVIVARFSPEPSTTHGHHTASAVLALEAFKLAGDPTAYPEQLGAGGLTPWQPKRIFQNTGGFSRASNSAHAPTIKIEAGGNDVVTGESFGSIAARSRGMHITQGFGNFGGGGRGADGPRQETFTLLAGEPATDDILDGIDGTWTRFPGGAEIGQLTNDVIARFSAADPAASVPALLAIRSQLAALPTDPVITDKRRQLDHILQVCLGLTTETLIPSAENVPGVTLKLTHTATAKSSVPVRWIAVRYPSLGTAQKIGITLAAGQPTTRESSRVLPLNTIPSQPYWLRAESTPGMFVVADANLIGRPENPPAFPIENVFEVGGQTLVIADEPVQLVAGASPAQAHRRLDVIAPVSLGFASEVELFTPGTTKPVVIEVTAARAGAAGTLRLDAPAGWTVTPASLPFSLKTIREKTKLTFTLTAPPKPVGNELRAVATISGVSYDNQRLVVSYPHIPVQLLQPVARLKIVALDLAIRGKAIGYLPGAGDSTAENLAQMGYVVTTLTGADLTAKKLKNLDAVVIGVRAFNERTDLSANLPGLFAYIEAGGTVVAQYNRPSGLKTPQLAPYKLSIAGDAPSYRVTDENSPVTFLAPDNPVLTTPNHITPADFEGWVQERGAYFPSSWDEEHFVPVLSMNDPGESPLKSSVLVAKYGKGYFVYTGLAFFRQLPAGVPGAYRLFANLTSLGK